MASTEKRRPVNITLQAEALNEAKALGLNLSRVAEEGILAAIRLEKQRRYLAENEAAIAEYNAWVEKRGPLATPLWQDDDAAF